MGTCGILDFFYKNNLKKFKNEQNYGKIKQNEKKFMEKLKKIKTIIKKLIYIKIFEKVKKKIKLN